MPYIEVPAFPCEICGLGQSNRVHKEKAKNGYHPYQGPAPEQRVLTLANRIASLEQRMAALEKALLHKVTVF